MIILQKRVLWFYGINRPENYIAKQGMPQDLDEFEEEDFVILDDLMSQANKSDLVTDLITNVVHHRKCTVFILTQNFFQQGKQQRTRHLNSHYLVLFKNPRDSRQIQYLANQMYGKNSKFLVDAYNDATKKPHGYLFIDLRQETPENLRIRSNILPLENPYVVYINNI